jgi:hypothetical protein
MTRLILTKKRDRWTGPAGPNEASRLELSGSGQPPDSSESSRAPENRGADILFLSETKLDKRRMEHFRWMLGLSNMVVRNCVGKGGELQCFGGGG